MPGRLPAFASSTPGVAQRRARGGVGDVFGRDHAPATCHGRRRCARGCARRSSRSVRLHAVLRGCAPRARGSLKVLFSVHLPWYAFRQQTMATKRVFVVGFSLLIAVVSGFSTSVASAARSRSAPPRRSRASRSRHRVRRTTYGFQCSAGSSTSATRVPASSRTLHAVTGL